MAEQLLDCPHVVARPQRVGREGVAQRVGRDALDDAGGGYGGAPADLALQCGDQDNREQG